MPRKTENSVKNALSKAADNHPKKPQSQWTMQDWVKNMQPQIEKALPKTITPERFTRMVLTALSTTPQLAGCSPQSFCAAMMNAAQLGLEPNTPLGQAYLIPYGGKVQFQLGYKGLLELAHRSGEITSIEARTVYENDFFEFEYGRNIDIKHKPALHDKGKPIAFYASYHTKSGGFNFEVMSIEDIEAHARKYSQAYKRGRNSPWKTSFEAMAKKTVLKQLLKYAPLATDFIRDVNTDESIKSLDFSTPYQDVRDMEDEIIYEVEETEPDSEPADVPFKADDNIQNGQQSML